jgi:hypothetical protein
VLETLKAASMVGLEAVMMVDQKVVSWVLLKATLKVAWMVGLKAVMMVY